MGLVGVVVDGGEALLGSAPIGDAVQGGEGLGHGSTLVLPGPIRAWIRIRPDAGAVHPDVADVVGGGQADNLLEGSGVVVQAVPQPDDSAGSVGPHRHGVEAAARFDEPHRQTDDRGADANDCLSLYNAGGIRLAGIDPDTGTIDFGDNASEYARDGQCDDPRFTGPGTAWDWVLLMENRGHDATDCRTLYETGEARLFGIAVPERRVPNAPRH